jgi:hypothetical protein
MEAHGGAIVNVIADIWNGWPEFAHSGAARGARRHVDAHRDGRMRMVGFRRARQCDRARG